MRLDGFFSLAANHHDGALLSRPFVLESDTIEINARTYGGAIRYELVAPYHEKDRGNPAGKPIAGFTQDDCEVFRGDELNFKLSWRGGSDLSTLRGRRVMLKMALQHAEIYSFTI